MAEGRALLVRFTGEEQEALYVELRERAHRAGVPMAVLVREAIEQRLARPGLEALGAEKVHETTTVRPASPPASGGCKHERVRVGNGGIRVCADEACGAVVKRG